MIRTPEDLETALAEQLAWRKKELSQIKGLIELAQLKEKKDFLLRSGITILYAHWEGYLLCASNYYLEFVSRRRLTYGELSPNFVAYCLEGRFLNSIKVDNDEYISLIGMLTGPQNSRANIKYNIDAGGNLNSIRLKKIISILGLNYSEYETKQNLIDETLLKNRNEIAHGNYLLISLDRYKNLHDEIVSLMDLFKNQISNAVSLNAYLISRS